MTTHPTVGSAPGRIRPRHATAISLGTLLLTAPEDCSLRGALRAATAVANAGPVDISIPAGLYRLTIPGADEDGGLTGDLDYPLRLNQAPGRLTITGAGVQSTVLSVARSGYAQLYNTIIDGGCAGAGIDFGIAFDRGGNLESGGDTRHLNPATNQVGIAPSALALRPLADHGGSTPTAALGPGSVAIDAGDPTHRVALDPRGVARDDACDVGAYESEGGTCVDLDGDGYGAAVARARCRFRPRPDILSSRSATCRPVGATRPGSPGAPGGSRRSAARPSRCSGCRR